MYMYQVCVDCRPLPRFTRKGELVNVIIDGGLVKDGQLFHISVRKPGKLQIVKRQYHYGGNTQVSVTVGELHICPTKPDEGGQTVGAEQIFQHPRFAP